MRVFLSLVILAGLVPAKATARIATDRDGVWRVVPAESFVGYRVRERLSFLPAPSDAVGRTSAIVGSATVEGDRIVATTVLTDLRTLQSDQQRRDRAVIWRLGGYPRAKFVLRAPIRFPVATADDRIFAVAADARLTIHGVTRIVTFPLRMRWTDYRLQVIGGLKIKFADYKIGSVRVGPVLSVGDTAKIEVRLSFEHA
jgi:hypothetical protein